MLRRAGPKIDVVVNGQAGRSLAGIAAHRCETQVGTDLTTHDGIPCTTVARTLVDLAPILDAHTLRRAIDRAELAAVFDLDQLEAVVVRNPRRRGALNLKAVLADYTAPAMTLSQFEDAFYALLDRAGLPRPQTNAWIPLEGNTGYSPDFLWPEPLLVVEFDSHGNHSTHAQRQHDARRDRRLQLAGYTVLRYTDLDLSERSGEITAEIAAFLSR